MFHHLNGWYVLDLDVFEVQAVIPPQNKVSNKAFREKKTRSITRRQGVFFFAPDASDFSGGTGIGSSGGFEGCEEGGLGGKSARMFSYRS